MIKWTHINSTMQRFLWCIDIMGQDQSSAGGNSVEDNSQGKQKAKLDDIIVVSNRSEEAKKDECDAHIQQLKKISLHNPILMQFSGGDIEYVKVPRISSIAFTEMLLRYQFHLTECAEAVSFDQNVLSKRIKEVNTFSACISKNLNERHKYIENVILQVEKVSEIENMLDKIEMNLRNTKEKFICLNKHLPEEERIQDSWWRRAEVYWCIYSVFHCLFTFVAVIPTSFNIYYF